MCVCVQAELAARAAEEHRRSTEETVTDLKASERELQEQLLESQDEIKRLQVQVCCLDCCIRVLLETQA